MSNLPQERDEQIQWFEDRIDQWVVRAVQIGVTVAQMNNFKPIIVAARDALSAATLARAASKAATQAYYNAVADMLQPGRGYITTIKGYAESTDNPDVLSDAMIDPPASRSPAPAPSAPTDFTGGVSPTGVVTLAWRAARSGPSSGVVFLVARRKPGEAVFTLLGATQDRRFIDPAAGVCDGVVLYQVKAQRGNAASDWTTPLSFSLESGPTLTAGFAAGEGGVAAAA